MSAVLASMTRTGARPFPMNTFMPAAKPSPVSVMILAAVLEAAGGRHVRDRERAVAVSTQTLLQQSSAALLQSPSVLQAPAGTARIGGDAEIAAAAAAAASWPPPVCLQPLHEAANSATTLNPMATDVRMRRCYTQVRAG